MSRTKKCVGWCVPLNVACAFFNFYVGDFTMFAFCTMVAVFCAAIYPTMR